MTETQKISEYRETKLQIAARNVIKESEYNFSLRPRKSVFGKDGSMYVCTIIQRTFSHNIYSIT